MMDQWLKTGSMLKRDNCDTGGEGATSSSKMTQNIQLKRKNRKYCDEYLSCGFICRGSEDEQKPHCVLCSEILSNESMKPAKLCLHFETKHKEHTKKPVEYFQRRWQELLSRQNVIEKIATGCEKKNAVSASYDVSFNSKKWKTTHNSKGTDFACCQSNCL